MCLTVPFLFCMVAVAGSETEKEGPFDDFF